MPPRTVAVLLAAGSGSRYHGTGHKLFANLPGSGDRPAATVIERALTHVLAADIGPVVVVTGAERDVVPAALLDLVTVRHNADWPQGQATSVHEGLAAVAALDGTVAVIGLADQPFITPDAWRRVAATPSPIAVATYDGERGNPVRLAHSVWHLLPTEGDVGARTLMRVRPDLVREVPCSGSPADIDTEEDLQRWQNS
jgi:CTP:molybdopterin cytidylyltransferase MocA